MNQKDRFLWKEKEINCLSICNTCIHKFKDKMGCQAFPNDIPDKILFGDNNHKYPYPGDNGIQYNSTEE